MMPFKKKDVENLLAATGRRCCICKTLHNVQIHHIVPLENGGDDEIDNAIPLCPSCHDRVHVKSSTGRTTRDYTPEELKLHRDNMILYLQKTAEKDSVKLKAITNTVVKTKESKVMRKPIVKKVVLPHAIKKDCAQFNIKTEEVVEFILAEAKSHPLMFAEKFTSMPLVFGSNVLILSWDYIAARIERLLSREEAYPLHNLWSSCLGLYRKATLLSYRTQKPERLAISSERKLTLSVFKRLLEGIREYGHNLELYTGTSIQNTAHLQHLFDEAEFALTEGSFGTAVATFEALLSSVHKLVLNYAPQGRGAGQPQVLRQTQLQPENPDKKTILFVDDDKTILGLLKLIMDGDDYQYYTASDPREAMQLLVDRDFNLIVTDIVMPYADGRELVSAAKKSGSRAKIIILSAFSGLVKKSKAGTDEFPFDIFIAKPFNIEELRNAIKLLIGPSSVKKRTRRKG
jgi:CheY-like chemotaxis protein